MCWADTDDQLVLGLDLIKEITEKVRVIRERLRVAQSRQKLFSDKRRHPFEFSIRDLVFLKVSPQKGIRRFGVRGKLAPGYVGPFKVIKRVRTVAYKLELPP